MRDRVRPPRDLEPILDRLKDDGVFETKQKGMMFAAAAGFALHGDEVAGIEIEHFGEGIRLDYFRTSQDEGFIDALAVANCETLNVLDPDRQEERVELFENYAMLGLRELKRHCYDDRPDDPLLGLFALIDEMKQPGGEDLPGLDAAAKQLEEFI